ncbi:Hypothetical protein GLP15_2781 [Giardia lamblia P15]|uniref:Uncharacterized protein n=1 Tax=Giardia intestinalis (strain P15) TaxID=658858 RepID=E1F1Z1_GIAIA|nr:Hypothetical protein GLP15_2781 [Giardia lamblia P15]
MNARSWLREDASIVAQRLQLIKKYPKRLDNSSKSSLPTSSTSACLRNFSAPETNYKGSTYTLYIPQESSTATDQVSIIYNSYMCWKAVKKESTRTLVLRNLALDDTENFSVTKHRMRSRSSNSYSDFQQPYYAINNLQLTVQDCSVSDKETECLSGLDRVYASAVVARHARQLVTSLDS